MKNGLYRKLSLINMLCGISLLLLVSACNSGLGTTKPTIEEADTSRESISYVLPTQEGTWIPSAKHRGNKPADTGTIIIEGIGEYLFNSTEIRTLRSDIFQPGYFSLFDVLVYLSRKGDIGLEYHYDGNMDTHVIDSINGEPYWWYQAKYTGGWYETNVFRMDMYPYKEGTEIRLNKQQEQYIARICRTFGDEVLSRMKNGGKVVVPEVTIEGPSGNTMYFTDVKVTPHDVRLDVFQPGIVTALDILLSLGEQGKLSDLKLTWYESIDSIDPVQSYWVEQINDNVAFGGCGFVYETGPREFSGFAGSHIHIPMDTRILVSPEYMLLFWICL